MIPVVHLTVYACVAVVAGLCASAAHVSAWLLRGLHSYLYPNDFSGQGESGLRNTKSRELQDHRAEGADGNKPYAVSRRSDLKRKEKSKDKLKLEEGSSQIYRLTLSPAHLVGRIYYAEYDEVVVYSVVGLTVLFVHECLSHICHFLQVEVDEKARKFDLVPFLVSGFAVYKVVRLLAQVSWQSSTSRVSELMLSIVVGFVGFLVALGLLIFASSLLLNDDMEILFPSGSQHPAGSDSRGQIGVFMFSPMFSRVILAVISGILAGILMTPAHRVARSFWLGTDQLRWNIPMAKWGVLVRFLLHVNVVVPLVSTIIWIKPMASLFVISDASWSKGQDVVTDGNAGGVQFWGNFLLPAPSDEWARDFGLRSYDFGRVQFWSIFAAGLLHLALFRVHVQTYLNEALLLWYEGLHCSRVMNSELVNTKLLLNSYFLCRASVQYLVPAVLLTLLLGMSRIWGDVTLLDLAETSPTLLSLRIVALFTGWWVAFSWSILTCITLALYRAGFLLV